MADTAFARPRRYGLSAWAALAIIALILGGTTASYTSAPSLPAIASANVKVLIGDGHGSGVYLGRGYYLTAAHVVDHGKPVIKTDQGASFDADILWSNKDYDLALIYSEPGNRRQNVARLDCQDAKANTLIYADGSPMNYDFLRTSGRVASSAKTKQGDWAAVQIVDITILPGMSGGAVFDRETGSIVGIAVGVAIMPMPTSAAELKAASLTGLGMMVPASVACKLMARGV